MNYKELILNSPNYNFLKENIHLGNNIMLLTMSGSIAYGTNLATSDTDVRGITLERPNELLGLDNFDQFENKETDTTIYSFRKIVSLLLNCNPNCIEILVTNPEHVLIMTEEGKLLRDNISLFLSKRAANSFGGYATAQLKRLENALARDQYDEAEKEKHILVSIKNQMRTFCEHYGDYGIGNISLHIDRYLDPKATLEELEILESEGELKEQILINLNLVDYPLRHVKGIFSEMNNVMQEYGKLNHRNNKKDDLHLNKHAMHLYRLLTMGTDILEGKEAKAYRDKDHDLLMSIRNGEYSDNKFASFFELVDIANKNFKYAEENSPLLSKPDYNKINELVISISKKAII